MELRRASATAALPSQYGTAAFVKTWPVLTRHALQQLGYAQFGSGAVSRMLLGVDSMADIAGFSAFLAGSRSAGRQGVLGSGDGILRAEFPAAALQMGWVATNTTEPGWATAATAHIAVPGEHLGDAWTLRRTDAALLLTTLGGAGTGGIAAAREVNAKLAALGADVAAAIVSGDAGAAARACAADVSHLSATVPPGRQNAAMRNDVRPLLISKWPRDHVPSTIAATASAGPTAAMPAAVRAGDNCTRGALVAVMADAWVRDFVVTFSCPGHTIANNSLPREGCAYTHSGMFISLQARRLLFDGCVDFFAFRCMLASSRACSLAPFCSQLSSMLAVLAVLVYTVSSIVPWSLDWCRYVDPFASYLTQRDVERTEPTMRYQCRNAKRFLFRTMSFAATQAVQAAAPAADNGTVLPKPKTTVEDVDPFQGKVAMSTTSTDAVPAGWSFGNDDRCRPIYDLDCSDDGYEITIPKDIRDAAAGFKWKPMVYDRTNLARTEGQQSDLYFPLNDEWFLPEIVLPIDVRMPERIGGSNRWFITSRVVSPVYAAFLGSTNRERSRQGHRNCQLVNKTMAQCDKQPPVKEVRDEVRNQQCYRDVGSRLAPVWSGCDIRLEAGSTRGKVGASNIGKMVTYRGSNLIAYLGTGSDGRSGAPALGDVFANGWQGKAHAHLWGGFETVHASRGGVEATLPHATLRYALADALLDKDGDMGGALPLALPFDGVHTQAYAKGDNATGATNLTFLAEVDMHRYCVTKDAWADGRKEHDMSFLAKSAVETSRIEGDPRMPVPLGMIDLEPSTGWPLVLSLPFFLGDEQWDAANSPAKDIDIVTVGPEQAKTAHRLYHNTCYFHEPITGRFMRMEQRTQVCCAVLFCGLASSLCYRALLTGAPCAPCSLHSPRFLANPAVERANETLATVPKVIPPHCVLPCVLGREAVRNRPHRCRALPGRCACDEGAGGAVQGPRHRLWCRGVSLWGGVWPKGERRHEATRRGGACGDELCHAKEGSIRAPKARRADVGDLKPSDR